MNVRNDMVTVFVVRPDETGNSQEFLQLRRSAASYMGGTWAIVRGGVEVNESYIEAALRELREETTLSPREFYRLASVESFFTADHDTLWHSVAFCAMVDREQPVKLNHEHDAQRWVPRDRFEAEILWASERQVLADLFRDILGGGLAKSYLRIQLGSAS